MGLPGAPCTLPGAPWGALGRLGRHVAPWGTKWRILAFILPPWGTPRYHGHDGALICANCASFLKLEGILVKLMGHCVVFCKIVLFHAFDWFDMAKPTLTHRKIQVLHHGQPHPRKMLWIQCQFGSTFSMQPSICATAGRNAPPDHTPGCTKPVAP